MGEAAVLEEGAPAPASDICGKCGAELNLDEKGWSAFPDHECCVCRDSRRVREMGKDENGRFYSRAVLCPGCQAAGRFDIPIADVLQRMRVPLIFHEESIQTWEPANGGPRLAVEDYVSSWPPRPRMLMLAGPVKGTGKSHLAAGIARAMYERHGKFSAFWPVELLLQRYRATFDEAKATENAAEIDAEMRRADVLILDDLGVGSDTPWVEARIFALVDERARDLRPLVITCNVDPRTLPERVMDRMRHAVHARVVLFDTPRSNRPRKLPDGRLA